LALLINLKLFMHDSRYLRAKNAIKSIHYIYVSTHLYVKNSGVIWEFLADTAGVSRQPHRRSGLATLTSVVAIP